MGLHWISGAGGTALKDELCHVLVGAGCSSNELPACNGKHIFEHYTDSANALGMIKRKRISFQVTRTRFGKPD